MQPPSIVAVVLVLVGVGVHASTMGARAPLTANIAVAWQPLLGLAVLALIATVRVRSALRAHRDGVAVVRRVRIRMWLGSLNPHRHREGVLWLMLCRETSIRTP